MGELSAFSILSGIVGQDVATQVVKALAGETVYVPCRVPLDPTQIRSEFDRILPGSASVMSAYETVADAHCVSAKTVQRIVRKLVTDLE